MLVKLEFSQRVFEKYSNIKIKENLFSGSPVVPCGRTDGQTDMMKPIVAFRNFANTPKTQRTKRPRFRESEFYLQKRPTFLETEIKICLQRRLYCENRSGQLVRVDPLRRLSV